MLLTVAHQHAGTKEQSGIERHRSNGFLQLALHAQIEISRSPVCADGGHQHELDPTRRRGAAGEHPRIIEIDAPEGGFRTRLFYSGSERAIDVRAMRNLNGVEPGAVD